MMTMHNRFLPFRFARPSQAGFTLIELMVGLAIGMLATLVVMQVFSVFEVQKRTTTGTADAQTNGNIALYNVTRELVLAGYGLVPAAQADMVVTALECPSVLDYSSGSAVSGDITPVTIVDGGSGKGGDSITIRYGTSPMGGIPTKILQPPDGTAASATVQTNLGCEKGDVVLAMNWTATPAVCALTKVSSAVQPDRVIVFEDNQAITASAVVNDGKIACLGTWREVTYSVDADSANLLKAASAGAAASPIVAGIVNMQAQYGIAAAGLANNNANFNQVVQWVDAADPNWKTPTVANRNRIKAVRIAIVARNATSEPGIVTEACSSESASSPTGLCAWDATSASAPIASDAPKIDLNSVDPNWGHYRYKVFETIIPLRNVIWAKEAL